ncbi:MAG: aldehyde dehydrogenase family protein [Armatimonadetes bacterium]|nr:aldehyde dehydrogenase family protein [Armatimonadota bacterium]
MAVATALESKLLIDGKWIETSERLEVRSPQGGIAGTTYLAGESEVEEAIRSSIRGFHAMKSLPSYKRYEILRGIADRLKERKEDFARTMTVECGKPIKDSRGEVDRAIMTFTIASEEAKRLPGDSIPLDLNPVSEGRLGLIRRFPIGPVLGITPFNFPLNLVAHKVAPALAAGNSIIVKPAPRTPFSALLLGEIAMGSGAPPGAVNVIVCSNELARKMVADERIKALSFTGGTDVGWQLKPLAGKKKVLLELGGNAAAVIDEDADVEYAAERCVVGAYYFSGQSCISVQRIYVHRSRYDEFMSKFIDLAKQKKIGDPMDESTDIGPMIEEPVAQRIEQWVNEAVERGAKVLVGGVRRGGVYEPTLLAEVDPRLKISCEEAFGPVAVVEPFDDVQEAIDKVNDSRFGLQAGIFSNDLEHIFRAYREIEVGQVIVNDAPTYRIDHMPYGGIKDSGFGREGIRYAVEELTEMKLLAINPK